MLIICIKYTVVTAVQGLIDAADEQLKVREKNMTTDLKKVRIKWI